MAEKQINEAFVLAAGLGTRMRPITDTIPKPLVKVAGKTLLDHALDALAQSAIETCVVNIHYLADMIEDHLKNRQTPRIVISDERAQLMNSGGGVKFGAHHLSDAAFILLNADSFWKDRGRNNLDALIGAWRPDEMDMLMLLSRHDDAIGFDGAGDFFMDDDRRLRRRADAPTAPYAYAGALIAKPDLYRSVEEEAFNMNILFDEAIAKGRLFGVVLDGLWLHVGTPSAIEDAETAITQVGL